MQFNVEKRTRELLDQRPATQQIAVVTQPSLSTISNIVKVNQEKAPEWLKQKDFEEELKKMNASHLIEAQKKIEVNEKPQIDLPHSQILKEPKVEEKPVIISSNRQILFGSNTVDQQEESEPSRPGNDFIRLLSLVIVCLKILKEKRLVEALSKKSGKTLMCRKCFLVTVPLNKNLPISL